MRRVSFFFDCVSPYSLLAFRSVRGHQERWAAQGVKVDYKPVFLGGIMAATSNRPPGMVPAKGMYMQKDLERCAKAAGDIRRGRCGAARKPKAHTASAQA